MEGTVNNPAAMPDTGQGPLLQGYLLEAPLLEEGGAQALRSIFSGDHAWCGEKMCLSQDLPDAIALPTFFGEGGFDAALDRFAREKGAADRRAAASFWSLYYFSALAIPFVVAQRAGWVLPISFTQMTIALGDDGLPRAFGLSTEGGWGEGGAGVTDLILPLVEDHLCAVVPLLKAHGGIAPKLAWNNAAVYIDYALNATAAAADTVDGDDGWTSRPLFESGAFSDGRKNPFLGCLRHEEMGGAVHCRRKVCCLRYQLPGIPGCGELCALPEMRHA